MDDRLWPTDREVHTACYLREVTEGDNRGKRYYLIEEWKVSQLEVDYVALFN